MPLRSIRSPCTYLAIGVQILNCLKELSMDPCTLEYLQRVDAIKQLVPFLERRSGIYAVQIHTEVKIVH